MLEQFNAVDIPLTNGGFATVDIADAPRVLTHRWYRNGSYARSTRGKFIYLHQFLIETTAGQEIDHKDGNGLNNRRANLRIATGPQNQANRGPNRSNKLGVKCVYTRGNGRYHAHIKVSGKTLHLGTFSSIEQASLAYQNAARKYFGDFASHAGHS